MTNKTIPYTHFEIKIQMIDRFKSFNYSLLLDFLNYSFQNYHFLTFSNYPCPISSIVKRKFVKQNIIWKNINQCWMLIFGYHSFKPYGLPMSINISILLYPVQAQKTMRPSTQLIQCVTKWKSIFLFLYIMFYDMK